MELIVGTYYSKEELLKLGLELKKVTSSVIFYRNGKMIYIFNITPDEDGKYKLASIFKD